MARLLSLTSFKIFPPHMGGQKGVFYFYKYLSNYHDIHMVVSRDNTEAIETTLPVYPMLYPNKEMIRNLFIIRRLADLVRKLDIDCIIAEHSYTGWIAWLLKKMTGRPFAIHSHNLETYRFKQMKRSWWPLYRLYEKWIHQKADCSFFISEIDKAIAVKEFNIEERKCWVAPYGIEPPNQIVDAHNVLKQQLGLHSKYIFYFNGTLDYEPNIEAVQHLIDKVNPELEKKQLDYTIIISGKRLSGNLQNKIKSQKRMIYIDYASDVELVYQGSDLFLNTVTNDSGIKTKLVEAIANNCTAISTESGSKGIKTEVCGSKLKIVRNEDWQCFVDKIVGSLNEPKASTQQKFYSFYAWQTIAAETATKLEQVIGIKK